MAGNYTTIRSHRGSISIQINREGKVIVKAPYLVPQFFIDQFVASKKEWIDKSLKKISPRVTNKKSYQEGEEFLYLGALHKLRFTSGSEIFAKNNTLFFPKGAVFRIKKELESWYRKQAEKLISERVAYRAKKMQATYSGVFFSDTSSKWGTCFHDNTLQFNWRLIMAPLMVIDYVVIHELTHTKEKNHQDSFWRRVRLFTPAYRQHRKWLQENEQRMHF